MSQPPTPCAVPGADIAFSDPERAQHFQHWLTEIVAQHSLQPATLRLASADASFRRYFRIDSALRTNDLPQRPISYIIMDAPPAHENCQPFVKVAALMQVARVLAPQVLAWQQTHGFMLLTDLGDQTMMHTIDPHHSQANLPLYLMAIDALLAWQLSSKPGVLPPYDEALLRRELALFPDWYISQHKGIAIDAAMRFTLDNSFAQIVANNQAQPCVFVHRDFMPRNLMVPNPQGQLGVLDFQDAVYGPITYDIASLMRDAFLSWDEDFCLDVTIRYWEKARHMGLPVGDDFGAFYRAVEWMGLQRHLKVAGIFARLTLRDGKPQYLADAPRFIGYIRHTCARYRELGPLLRLVDRMEGIVTPDIFGFGRQ